MDNKITYTEFNQQLTAFQEARLHGRILPKPDLRDVDLNSVPAEKRTLVEEMVKLLPEKK